ncbi:MAG: hypothetical protein RLZZ81_507, partial [Pseudomonadota bacterium]
PRKFYSFCRLFLGRITVIEALHYINECNSQIQNIKNEKNPNADLLKEYESALKANQEYLASYFPLIKEYHKNNLLHIALSHGISYHKEILNTDFQTKFEEFLYSDEVSENDKNIIESLLVHVNDYISGETPYKKKQAVENYSKILPQLSPDLITKLSDQYSSLNNDLNTLIDAIDKNTVPNLTNAILKDKLLFSPSGKEYDVPHAEMQHLNYVIEDFENSDKKDFFIVTSRLCCNACHLSIQATNELYNMNIETVGTHGNTYIKWNMPDVPEELKTAIIKKFKEQVHAIETKQGERYRKIKDLPIAFKPSLINLASEKEITIDKSLLNLSQIITAFKKNNNNVDIIDADINTYNGEITNNAEGVFVEAKIGLKAILENRVLGKPNIKLAIPFNVHTLDKSFLDTEESKAKEEKAVLHWVGLYVETDEMGKTIKLNYIDPMGHPINPKIKNSIEELLGVEVHQPTLDKAIQYVEISNEKVIVGNDYDCGIFIAYLLAIAANNESFPEKIENLKLSEEKGQELRKLLLSTINNQHLTHTEKENFINILESSDKYNLKERLAAINDNKELLNKFDREATITANIGFKAIDAQKSAETGIVEIRAEHNHLTDHANNTKALIAEIQTGKIDKNTVIAIERKQYGENLGMKDVIKIANILEHNENNPNALIKLPAELKNTPILQDALLYKIAKENKIKIISLEGKNLEHLKDTPLYNENREQYMTDVINEIRGKGYNVIASVGSSHVENLEKNLNTTKHNNTGFNNIPGKLQEDTSSVRGSISKEIISRHLATQPKSSKSKVSALLASRKNNLDKAVKGI